jgi:hypothetical protein
MNWSEHIPLVTLIAVVFSAGVLYAQHGSVKRDLRSLIDKTIPRIHERLDKLDKWQTEERTRRRIRTEGLGIPIHPDQEDRTP